MRLSRWLPVLGVFLAACPKPPAGELDSGVPCGSCQGGLCTDDDGPCGAGAHCDLGSCHADVADGTRCDEDTDCASHHCADHVCCAGGDCCLTPADCPAATNPPRACDSTSTCQGHREDPTCSASFQCGAQNADDDSACGPSVEAMMCGPYAPAHCDGGADQPPPACPTACSGDDGCVPGAFCSAAGACTADLSDGAACTRDAACASGHCQNGFCCGTGDCCAQASDCPGFGTQMAVCDVATTCQGSRGEAVCGADHRCTTTGTAQDDSACRALSKDCGPYPSVFCDGGMDQAPPPCASGCQANADCDSDAFCDPVTHLCVPDLGDGQACGSDPARCASAHCQNGFCCASGDCCAVPSDCPASYTGDGGCDLPSQCQGSRDLATCTAGRCGTVVGARDDSACTSSVLSSTCGFYPSALCSGASMQTAAQCASGCGSDSDCDVNGYCDAALHCVADVSDGTACARDGQCQSGHCQNGFCCASGDCCAAPADCTAYAAAAVCDTPTSCQGHRVDGACLPTRQCGAVSTDDDSACAGQVANTCGPYPSVTCSAAQAQTAPACATTCADDNGCDTSAHCSGGACVPDVGQGGFCTLPGDCTGGLFCVDNVCCSSQCTGTCEACDLSGTVGTCTAVPTGLDPDAECGAVSCLGFYHSWSGDSCRRKADVTAAQASCNGARACRTQAQECTAQSSVGPVTVTCNATCQDPNLSTCTGTTAGTCTNVNPGSQTCGQGACAVTVPQCVNGAPNTCTPGTPTTETCNGIDDNCDGTIDNGAFSDAYEPNPDCGTARVLAQAGSDQTLTYTSMTIYGSGDYDYYALPLRETDTTCGCGLFSIDEDYQLRLAVTVPANAGSYEVCLNVDTCGWPAGYCFTAAAGTTLNVSMFIDGQCSAGTTDAYTAYVRVRGLNAPGFQCHPYTLTYTFDSGLCR